MQFLLAFGFALCLTTVLVPFFIRYATALNLMDEPNESRKIHVSSIPRCGGLGIVIGVLFASIYWLENSGAFWSLGLASLTIVIFGYLDDSRDLNYRWKFLGQFLATGILMSGGVLIEELPFFGLDAAPTYLSYPITFFFILGITNAVNLSDGLDGLAAGNTLISLLLIAILSIQTGNPACLVMAAAIMGGLLGFLRYNTHPARVFLGDTGSQFLGFVTASLAIIVTQSEYSALNPTLPLLILGLPVLDTLMVMVIRTAQGRFIFSPDRNHIHHQLMALGLRHYEVVGTLYGLQTILVIMAYLLRFEADWLILLSYGLYALSISGFLLLGRLTGWRLRVELPANKSPERRNLLLRKFNWYYHHSSSFLVMMIGLFIVGSAMLTTVPQDGFPEFCLLVALFSSMAVVVFRNRWPNMVTRITFYSAAALLAYTFAFGPHGRPVFNGFVNVYLSLLLMAFLLAIRMTRKSVFRLDTHDYLICVLLLVTPLLPIDNFTDESLAQLVLRWALLVYICEFLLSKSESAYRWLNIPSLLCLLIFGTSFGKALWEFVGI